MTRQVNPGMGYGGAKFIVAPIASGGNYTTIQEAIDASAHGDTILLRSGTYNENVTMKDGVSLVAHGSGNVVIAGTVNFTSISATIVGIVIQTSGASCVVIGGSGSLDVSLENCTLDVTNSTAISCTDPSVKVKLVECECILGNANSRFFSLSGGGSLVIRDCECSATVQPTIASDCVNSTLTIYDSFLKSPLSISGTSSYFFSNLTLDHTGWTTTPLTLAGSAQGRAIKSYIFSALATAPVTIDTGASLNAVDCAIGSSVSTDAIAGAGSISYASLSFLGVSTSMSVATKNYFPLATGGVSFRDGLTLSRYDGGTFTPTIVGATTAGTATYSVQDGRYLLIGSVAFFGITVTWTEHTGTGQLRVDGLPLPASSGSNARIGIIEYTGGNTTTNATDLYCQSVPSNSYMPLFEINIKSGAILAVDVPAAATIAFEGFYSVD